MYTGPEELVTFNGAVYFTADDGVHGRELWKSTGDLGHAQLVKDIVPGLNWLGPRNLTVMGDALYFTAFEEQSQSFTLWKTTGTEQETTIVQAGIPYSISPWSYPGPRDFTVVNNDKLFFFVDTSETAGYVKLWVADQNGAAPVTDIRQPSWFEGREQESVRPVALENELFFIAGTDLNSDVWRSDGTAGGTQILKDIRPGHTSETHDLTVVGNKLYFAESRTGLWEFNGTEVGDAPVSTNVHEYALMKAAGNTLYFVVDEYVDEYTGTYLWKTNDSGTARLADCYAIFYQAYGDLSVRGSTLFFLANEGRSLRMTDGTSTTTVKDFGGAGHVVRLDSAGDLLVATVWEEATGSYSLWKFDPTVGESGALVKFADIPFTYEEHDADYWTYDQAALGNILCFTAFAPNSGRELWRTDGSQNGTFMVQNICPLMQVGNELVVAGTAADDLITVTLSAVQDVVGVNLNGQDFGLIAGVSQVRVYGASGEDRAWVNGTEEADNVSKNNGTFIWNSPVSQTIVCEGIEHYTLALLGGDDYVDDPGADTTILGGPGNDTMIITATGAGGVTIDGQEGSDIYEIQLGSLEGAVTVAESGESDVDVDSVTITGTDNPDTVTITGDAQQAAAETVVIAAPLESVVANMGEGDDQIVVTELVEPLSDLTVAGGAGSDTVSIVDVGSAVASLTVDGGTGIGEDQLEIEGELPPDVQIEHVAPVLNPLIGPSSCVRGQPITIAGSFTHPTASTWEATVDYGDGAGPSALALTPEGTFLLNHVYAASATSYTVSVQVTDDNGATASASFAIPVRKADVQLDAADASQSVLTVGGTAAADTIVIAPGNAAGTYLVRINSESLGSLSALPNTTLSRLLVFAQASDDDVQVAGTIELAAWLYGGPGDDRLKGGAGHDVLLGEDGADLLVGNSGRDILIGGTGADRIVGNADDDILIAGSVTFADLDAALAAIRSEWISNRSYQERIENLTCRQADTNLFFARANADYFLIANSEGLIGTTVVDDGDSDVLTGSAGLDWFFFNQPEDLDRATDLKDETFANVLDWILEP